MSCSSTSCCPSSRASTSAAPSGPGRRSPSSWSRPRARRSTPSSASRSARTTTSPSPTGMRELVARMRAVLRRAPGDAAGAGRRRRATRREAGCSTWATCGSTPTGTGSSSGARRSTSAARSSSSSPCSSGTPGRVLTRDTLIDRVWGTDYVGDTKTLDVHIKRLRNHLEEDPSVPGHHHHRPGRRVPLRGPRRRTDAPS